MVQLGDGRVGDGEVRPFYLQPGQTVVYSKFGFMYQDLKLSNGEEYILIREDDVIGIMPRASECSAGSCCKLVFSTSVAYWTVLSPSCSTSYPCKRQRARPQPAALFPATLSPSPRRRPGRRRA